MLRFTLIILVPLLVIASVLGYWQWDRYQARRAWNGADEAIAHRDLSQAADHISRYLTLRDEDAAGWFRAARIARRRGKVAEAKRYLSECERLGGDINAIRLERDLMLVQQGVVGEVDVRLRETIPPSHPDAPIVLEALARGYMAAGRWVDAAQACKLWRGIEPEAPWPWLWGGQIAEHLGQMEEAVHSYKRALELSPDDRDSHVAVARMQILRRHPAVAAPHYEWVLARHPDDTEALLGLAQCKLETGKAQEAAPLIERVLRRQPDSVPAIGLRGRLALENGDATGAEEWLRRAVQAEPANAESLHLLVTSLRTQRKDGEADKLAPKLESLKKDLSRLSDLETKIGLGVNEAGLWHEAGLIALRIGRTEHGLSLLQEALRRKGDHRPTHSAIASHYRRIGRMDLAEVHQALAEKP